MIEKILIFCTAFAVSWVVLCLLTPLAQRFAWTDSPNASRKRHTQAVPVIGGPALLFTLLTLGWVVMRPESDLAYFYMLLGAVVIATLGWFDDQHNLKVRTRLLGQITAMLLLTLGGGVTLTSLGNLFGFGELHLGGLSVPITVIAGVGLINAFNMIDGIDGLAAGLALVTLTFLYALLAFQGVTPAPVLLVVIAALVPFLAFNCQWPGFRKRYMFLGDSGSMLLGYIVVTATVYYSQQTPNVLAPVNALWLVALPLLDLFVVMLRRMMNGQSPMRADRRHLHHLLLRFNLTPRAVSLRLVVVAIGFATMGVYAQLADLTESLMLLLAFVVFATVFSLIIILRQFYRIIFARLRSRLVSAYR